MKPLRWVAALPIVAALLSAALSPADFDKPRLTFAATADPHLSSCRIVTWNIDRGTRLKTIEAELAENPAALLLLQEVDWNTARAGNIDEAAELAKHLKLNAAYGIEFEELRQEHGEQAFIGQATLTRLPMRRSRVLRFQHQSGFWKPRSWIPSSLPLLQRRLGSRIALATDLDLDGRLLVVYNLHLESRSYGRIQSEQLDEVLADLKQYPPDTAVIVGGDLNTKYFPSVFLHKLERAGFRSATGEHVERTVSIVMALDWIFAKGPVDVLQGAVRRDFKGSDHYPVYAELKARK
jgi:endonuclease/exonuclease/phosphatase family metal-dependent hydrolase